MADRQASRGDAALALVGQERVPLGRGRECGLIDGLLEVVRRGGSRGLMLEGEPGIGKTALLEYAASSAQGFRVERAGGVESEMELAFAALHQLCTPMLDGLGRLPDPQRDALSTAFGLRAGPTPDRFIVGVAVLSLLSESAVGRPLLCIIDDAQWLDRESADALAFVARRLSAESIALLLATRERGEGLGRLEAVRLRGLDNDAARELLSSVVHGPLDERVRDRIIAETRGNPLALLELPRGLGPAELAGGFALPTALALSDRIEESFLRRLSALSRDARLLLLVAAAEPVGDPLLVQRAAGLLGIDPVAVSQVAETELMEFDTRVRFRHPLVRSAIYGAASAEDRRTVHAVLAAATDAQADPDRRAWHRAQAAPAPDEEVATELEGSAGRAILRGGLAAAAAFLERAASLTPDPDKRLRRALAAAQAKFAAGAFDTARDLLVTAQMGKLDEAHHARVDLLYARIEFASGRGRSAAPLLLSAAKRMQPVDVAAAHSTYLGALAASMFAGRLAHAGGRAREVAQAVRDRDLPGAAHPAAESLLRGWSDYYNKGYAAGASALGQGLVAFGHRMAESEELSLHWLAYITALHQWDARRWEALAVRYDALSRKMGALGELPIALSNLVFVHLFKGEFETAAALVEQIDAAADATGTHLARYGALGVAAFGGDEATVSRIADSTAADVIRRGEGAGLTVIAWARAILYNALGVHSKALEAARQATSDPDEVGSGPWGAVELIEAAARLGDTEAAVDASARIRTMAETSRTDWALGVNARCRALLSEDASAERWFRAAVQWSGRCGMRVELARAHLTYGEWLRRQRRRGDAREQLRRAHTMFTGMGADAFASRAARALASTGEHARARTLDTRDDLTPQENQIARLAQSGLSNPEIAGRLFISSRTVEYHLSKVFSKLGIRTRKELSTVLTGDHGTSPVSGELAGP